MTPDRRPARLPAARTQSGFALAIVLILVTAMALLVAAQAQRGTSRQTLIANSSRYLHAETAAQSALRYCEAAMLTSVGMATSVRVTTPGLRGQDGPAWRDEAKWRAAAVDFGGTALPLPGVARYECLYEDASADLVPSLLANDVNAEIGTFTPTCEVRAGSSPRLCKYRVTARVTLDGGARFNLQSEVRFAI